MHKSAYNELTTFASTLSSDKPLRIGDVGSMNLNGCLRPIFDKAPWTYIGMDLGNGPNVDIVLASENEWSNIKDNEFDVVVSVSTLEHTRYPWLFMREISRIVKVNGLVCINAPYQWEQHACPLDCWRIFPDGMKALLEYVGLEVISVYKNINSEDPRYRGDTVGIGRKK